MKSSIFFLQKQDSAVHGNASSTTDEKFLLHSGRRPLHGLDLFFRQVVEVVDQAVDPAVRGVNLTFEVGLFVFRPGSGELPVEGATILKESDTSAVAKATFSRHV